MFTFLSTFLEKKQIDCFAALPLSECRIQKPYLLEREGIENGSVLLIAVPYYTPACQDKDRNLSAYAVSLNYHDFFEELFEELLTSLRKQFPNNRFAYFSDHSPIAEVEAASKAGLGVIGKNHLLLTHRYSSYIFLGELFTDAVLPYQVGEVTYCEDCGEMVVSADSVDTCPKCGGKIIEKKSKRGRVFYGCDQYPNCDFVSWDPPSKEKCPVCGKTLMQKKTKDKTLYCLTENCSYKDTSSHEE